MAGSKHFHLLKNKKIPELDMGGQICQLKSLYFLKVAILSKYIVAFT